MIHLIRKYLARRRQNAAKLKVVAMAEERARSPEIVDYRIRSAAAKAGWRRRRENRALNRMGVSA